MNDRKRSLRMLAFGFLAALCLCAFGASSAQAEGEWRINGEKLTGEEVLTGLIATTEEYLFLAPATKLVIHCSVKLWVGVKLLASGESHGLYRYDECKTLVSGVEMPQCKPSSIEISFKSKLILHNGKTYLLFSPLTGESFGTLVLTKEKEKEKACGLTGENKIKGSYVMECIEPASCEEEVLVHPMVFASAELFPTDKLTLGGASLVVHGRDIVEPFGVNIGKAFAAIG